jgi:hypothetical protein
VKLWVNPRVYVLVNYPAKARHNDGFLKKLQSLKRYTHMWVIGVGILQI